MIWLAMMSFAIGGLLAPRFKILVLAPATLIMLIIGIAIGVAQASSVWSIVSMITTASVGTQIGYFLGILIRHGMRGLFCFSDTRKNASISRKPIS